MNEREKTTERQNTTITMYNNLTKYNPQNMKTFKPTSKSS